MSTQSTQQSLDFSATTETNTEAVQTTNMQTITNIVWKACDVLRGVMDSSQYKDFILVFLFVKYISDYHAEKMDDLKAKFGDNQERLKRAIERERFQLAPESSFAYIASKKEHEDLGNIINTALARIEELNDVILRDIFNDIDFNDQKTLGKPKDRNAILKGLVEVFDDKRLNLRPSRLAGNDVLGDAYEYLISRFASDAGKKGGEFFTPKEISIILAKLVQAKQGERIYDPTCGSGSLLIQAALQVGNDKGYKLFGQEKNGQTYSLCRMNMVLHNVQEFAIEWGDTIRNPGHLEDGALAKFDVVVANPPFSLDKWGLEDISSNKIQTDVYKRFEHGLPPASVGDYAFVSHMIKSLNENGRMAVVLPHGVLFRSGAEGSIRQSLIENNLLDAVIGLPANLFFGTGIPAVILVFRKDRGERTDVLFIDASKEYDSGTNQNKLSDAHIEKIVATYHNRVELEKYSHIASFSEIKDDNDFNLNIPRYVDTFEPEAPVDLDAVKAEIAETEAQLTELRAKMAEMLAELGL